MLVLNNYDNNFGPFGLDGLKAGYQVLEKKL